MAHCPGARPAHVAVEVPLPLGRQRPGPLGWGSAAVALGAAALLALLISGPLGLPTAPSAAYRAPAHRAARKGWPTTRQPLTSVSGPRPPESPLLATEADGLRHALPRL
eukprot:EG_transcript_57825